MEQLIGPQAERIWLMTFHATCVRILRRDGAAIGVAPNFVIYDTQDQLIVVREVLRELNISETNLNPRGGASHASPGRRTNWSGPRNMRPMRLISGRDR